MVLLEVDESPEKNGFFTGKANATGEIACFQGEKQLFHWGTLFFNDVLVVFDSEPIWGMLCRTVEHLASFVF